jgi:hypothetical protein
MTNSPSVLIVFFLMVAAYRVEKKAVAVIERGLGFCNVCELRRQAQAIFCRRRHQPRRPPLPKIRPGSPAPTMGAGTARNTRLDAAMIFPVNKIPISTVIEGRGAQEMVALVLRPKPEESVRFAHCTLITGGNRRWTC